MDSGTFFNSRVHFHLRFKGGFGGRVSSFVAFSGRQNEETGQQKSSVAVDRSVITAFRQSKAWKTGLNIAQIQCVMVLLVGCVGRVGFAESGRVGYW